MHTFPGPSAASVLEQLQTVLQIASQQTGLHLQAVTVEFTALTQRSVGAGTPQFLILAKDAVGGDLTSADSSLVSFTLRPGAGVASRRSMSADLNAAIGMVSDVLEALKQLQGRWERSARIQLKFEVSSEGKLSFFVRAGAKAADAHTLTLDLAVQE
ncbi:hypothetical protein [Deinococcus sp.]|uniref:hypothetical protein n=1 Tax=Deinococcus sp. TaxID=47478 RepID=UPI003C7C639A